MLFHPKYWDFLKIVWLGYWVERERQRRGGLWFNIKMIYQYMTSWECGDKTVVRPSCLNNGNSYTGETVLLYWMWVVVGGFSKVMATFNHVGESFNLFMATTGDVWVIPSFRIWDYVLHVEHISCVITNCGQHQWVVPSPLSLALQVLLEENTTRKLLSLSLDLIFKILLFQVAFLIFFSIVNFSPCFLLVGLVLQPVALFQSWY